MAYYPRLHSIENRAKQDRSGSTLTIAYDLRSQSMDNTEEQDRIKHQMRLMIHDHTAWIANKNNTRYNTDCGILPQTTQH